jgi:soluble cytochrome b562
MRTPKYAWEALIKAAGSQAKLARAMRKSRATVLLWKKQVPEKRLARIEKLFGIKPWELRPDLYREKE